MTQADLNQEFLQGQVAKRQGTYGTLQGFRGLNSWPTSYYMVHGAKEELIRRIRALPKAELAIYGVDDVNDEK